MQDGLNPRVKPPARLLRHLRRHLQPRSTTPGHPSKANSPQINRKRHTSVQSGLTEAMLGPSQVEIARTVAEFDPIHSAETVRGSDEIGPSSVEPDQALADLGLELTSIGPTLADTAPEEATPASHERRWSIWADVGRRR